MSQNVAVLHPSDPDLRAQVGALMSTDRRITQALIARETGISPSAVNQWLQGKYPGDNEKLEAEVRKWFAHVQAERQISDSLPAAPDWVSTPSGDRVLATLKYAQMAGDIAVIYGGAGTGKTTAIKRYGQAAPNVWHATMTPATSSVVTCLEEICEALGMKDIGTCGAARLHRMVVRKVSGTRGLLVVDEAQHLSVAALDQVRSVHDATGIGIALVGNESVYARMTGGNRAPYLDRLYSRVGKRVRLSRSTDADIAALIDAWGIDDKGCRKELIEIAARPGALRGLTKVLRLAMVQAMADKATVCCEHVRSAWRELGGAE